MDTGDVNGAAKEAAGNLKDMVGAAIGDPALQLSGKAKALCGRSQELIGDAAEVARDTISESPLLVLGAAVAVGFVLGTLWARSHQE